MKLYIASDHAGWTYKQQLVDWLRQRGVEVIDLGPPTAARVDYPDFAARLCRRILAECSAEALAQPCGILVCGSGVGVSIAANRFPRIRAVHALREDVARLSREHNCSNVLCLGERLLSIEQAQAIVDAWLATGFAGGHHAVRVEKLTALDGGSC